ncbi:hypothetical protein HZS61_008880 [Fusarium oxysporum f. sp. conglutinans]|uniref:HTH CENPB-type domain-containing protein n=1 Tax=Fusarium oxysporum f. sp. conglutinans TaxID=100902 RepID=A0A8H6LRM0_FUSOX|nr:hypothetical protein HZS61_008532 [Fusarium oxysporum f. sp. conglutinans]KAF6528578.1 hypothetical protein HZS61_008880 [Fusarium oxysporum f. sp. conglutinans]KAG7001071.1 Pogo transposable element with ZNF domain [Fusarium oxysporum f. sp. conglutinans]
MAAIDTALEFLKTSGSINYAATAKKFECDETTLRRRHQGKQRARRDADSLYKSRLSKQQEQDLVTYIRKLSLRGIPPTLSMIRNFAQDIAKIEVGKNWPYSFVQRHRNEIDCTWFDGFDIARRRADNASRYRAYFDLIREKIDKYDILPQNTYNMDEKGFLLGVINRTKRVFDVNAKRQGKLLGASQDGNRSWITFLACICQDMTSLPPFLIYQGKPGQVQDTWLTDFDPEHQSAFFSTSETGWTSHELGKEWLIGVFDRFTKAKARNGRDYRLLITDGHSSHINMDFLDWCDAHRIIVAVFPPHSTHRLQPLDVSLFGPLSTAYTNRLVQWTSKTQGLTGLSKREFWVLFWGALEASFTPENIASGWRRTGLKPFDPDVVLSQVSKNTDDDSDVGIGLDDSIALQEPTARELRRLVDHVVKQSSVSSDTGARKLKRTLESLQAEVELLRHENQGLRETIIREKQRRQRGKALKDYIFDRVDPNSAQVFSPQKIAQARQKKIEMEAQKEEEALQKRTEKALRQKRVEEQKQQVLERKRQREEKKERKRREKETKQLEREANRQLRIEMKKQNQRSIQPKHQARQNGSDGLEENGGIQDEIIVVLPTVTQPPVLFKPPNEALSTPNTKALTPPSHKTRPKRPSLVVESDREVVVACRDSGRSQRNRKRPRWLDDFEVN